MNPDSSPDRRQVLRSLGMALLGGVVATGCQSTKKESAAPAGKAPASEGPKFHPVTKETLATFQNADLRLVRLVVNGESVSLPDATPITLRLAEGGKIAGRSAVNRYFGKFEFDFSNQLKWPPAALGMTRMAGAPEAMQLENQFAQGLTSTTRILATKDELRFESADGRNALDFHR